MKQTWLVILISGWREKHNQPLPVLIAICQAAGLPCGIQENIFHTEWRLEFQRIPGPGRFPSLEAHQEL